MSFAEEQLARLRGLSLFTRWILGATLLGALIRLIYIVRYPSEADFFLVGGDGLDYHLSAARLADGDGYVNSVGPEGPNAHHPPGWVTVLAAFTLLGGDSIAAKQYFTALIGLVLIVLIALVAKRLFGERTAVVAAFIAAIYPGFWVIEAQILAEPLGLVLLALALLSIYRFVDDPTTKNAIIIGVILGASALVRSDQLALLVLIPLALLRAPGLDGRRRWHLGGLIAALTVASLLPWTLHNNSRFEEPVLLSTNLGGTLLAGSCNTFSGPNLGFYDTDCGLRLAFQNRPADRSVGAGQAQSQAIENMGDNLTRLPQTMVARVGRALGLYRPSQTVGVVANWQGTSDWPIWVWVVSFWPIAGLAAVGFWHSRTDQRWLTPLVLPIGVAFAVVLVFYGEPRYHTPADLSVVILAAAGIVHLVDRWDKTRAAQ